MASECRILLELIDSFVNIPSAEQRERTEAEERELRFLMNEAHELARRYGWTVSDAGIWHHVDASHDRSLRQVDSLSRALWIEARRFESTL